MSAPEPKAPAPGDNAKGPAAAGSEPAAPPAYDGPTELLIDQLNRDVEYVVVTGDIPIRRYLEGSRALMLAGDQAFLKNDYATAFKNYKKFVRLLLVDLKKHMFYGSATHRKDIDELTQFARECLTKLETQIAPKIKDRRVPILPLPSATTAAADSSTGAGGADAADDDLTARLSRLAVAKAAAAAEAANAAAAAAAGAPSSLASIYTPKPPPGSLTAASVPAAGSAVAVASSKGMRTLHIPVSLIPKFKGMCDDNTRAGVETCALLMGREYDIANDDGTLATVTDDEDNADAAATVGDNDDEDEDGTKPADSKDKKAAAAAAAALKAAAGKGRKVKTALVVTHMVFPEQKGSPNSVETFNEERLIAVQEAHDVYALGWVHTHPTQTCFLSSVDLHCQCSYQTLLPEAVAVVVAPRFNETGLFHLTPGGMKTVAACREPPARHHPHAAPASDGGHLYVHTNHTVLHYPRGHRAHDAAALPRLAATTAAGRAALPDLGGVGAVTVVDLRKPGGGGVGGFLSGLFSSSGGKGKDGEPLGPTMYGQAAGLRYPSIPANLKLK